MTDVSEFAEMVEENKTGIIITNTDVAKISEEIKRYFNDGLKNKFISYIEAYKQKHSWKKLAVALISFIPRN